MAYRGMVAVSTLALLGVVAVVGSGSAVGSESVSAAEPGIQAEVLAKSTTDWRGAKLPPYSAGQPEVTIARVTIPEGMALPLHEHPHMTAGVVVQGVLEVRTDSGDTHIARAGDAVIELVNHAHFGANVGEGDVIILVVYAGIEGEPITIALPRPDA